MTDGRTDRAIGTLILGCAAYHLIAFASLHVLVSSLDPADSLITDYLDSSWRPLARSTFVAFGVMWAAVAVGLWRVLPRHGLEVLGLLLMAGGIAALFVVVLVPETAAPGTVSGATGGALVRAVSIGRLCLFASLLVLSLAVRDEPGWWHISTWLLTLSVASILLLAVTLTTLIDNGWGGLGQRAIFILLYAWAAIAAFAVAGKRR